MTDGQFTKLQAGITVTSSGSGSISADTAKIRELLDDPNPSIRLSELPPALFVSSLRNQIEYSVQPGKTEILDKSPDEPYGAGFPQIYARIINWMSEQSVEWQTHGWNFALTYSTGDTPGGSVIIGLLRERARRFSNELRGAALTLNYQFEGAKVTTKLEPRLGNLEEAMVFASANYHVDEAPPTTEDEARAISTGYWKDFIEACKHLLVEMD